MATSLVPEFSAIIDALPERIAILDEAADLVAINHGWNAPAYSFYSGIDGWRSILQDIPDPQFAEEGIADVLAGRRQTFQIEYSPDRDPRHARRMMVSLLRHAEKVYALIVNDDFPMQHKEAPTSQFRHLREQPGRKELGSCPRTSGVNSTHGISL